MLQEIIEYRKQGLSFRKIAANLNTTVGKVQYQWIKYQKQLEAEKEEVSSTPTVVKENTKPARQGIKKRVNSVLPVKSLWRKKSESYFHITFSHPTRIYCYWHLSSYILSQVTPQTVLTLRLFDVTDIVFNGHNAHYYTDTYVRTEQRDWFFSGLKGNRSYCIDLGVKDGSGSFFSYLRSNCIHTPASTIRGTNQEPLVRFLQETDSEPNWIEHVSTYSYYVVKEESL
ncbi:hypothetical protein Q75_09985 [Bacillus coahuilensis p1.1.43]|uniref:DUF4912 domain-containing protein n=1 Tax=Bacillus coahuilensis p1.1.43 TaxID=1150625 RepID=A0A147K7H0_9BACI|nr:DUF4912 domain-containing protein [Bacillus coahuilensis]KUP05985.1 hypothetical protein Q75_09985 [Bacillus coahuilensis p1.1.43]